MRLLDMISDAPGIISSVHPVCGECNTLLVNALSIETNDLAAELKLYERAVSDEIKYCTDKFHVQFNDDDMVTPSTVTNDDNEQTEHDLIQQLASIQQQITAYNDDIASLESDLTRLSLENDKYVTLHIDNNVQFVC